MFCSELAACALGSIGTLKLAGFDGTPVTEGDEARSFLPSDFCDETGGSRQIWFDCVKAAGCEDPYAPLVLMQFPGSPYAGFLEGLKKELRAAAGGKQQAGGLHKQLSRKHSKHGQQMPLLEEPSGSASAGADDVATSNGCELAA
jgi:hypothetical protein